MFGILRRIALSMSGVRGPEQGGRGETGRVKTTRNSASGRREVMAGAQTSKRIKPSASPRIAERPSRRDRGRAKQPAPQRESVLVPKIPEDLRTNYSQTSRTASEITAIQTAAGERARAELHEQRVMPPHKRLTPEQLDDIVKGQVELEKAMVYGQQQQQITQQQMNQQMGMINADLQNSVANMLGMGGAPDPLQGISRDRPYWESFYGNLGAGPQYKNRGGK